MGMVGGGRDAFIGAVHRTAAQMDGMAELVCGAFSSSRQKSIESGKDLGLDPERVYPTYRDMFRKESRLPDDSQTGAASAAVAVALQGKMKKAIATLAIPMQQLDW